MYEPSIRQRRLAVVAGVSAAIAVVLHVLGGAAVEGVTGAFVGVGVVATLGVLYVHGQRRGDDDDGDGDELDDETKRKQQEMKGRAGGMGGNGGH
ncbi:hypothetical protein [Halobacterium rubrum]|uniref:hypothetical protein n=1 Tax=Halobacterium TaxID=2239 RepID=UPI001F253D57|nr:MULTISPECIES: hypothetical protein [Halobacterium]MDH5021217.1 hypothetical protein [Halobacterium rubrum]